MFFSGRLNPSVFNIFGIKTRKCFKLAAVNPLHANLQNVSVKNNYFPQQNMRIELLYNFANLFSIWFERRQLASHMCFCINLL